MNTNPLKKEPAAIYGAIGYAALQLGQVLSDQELGTQSLVQAAIVVVVVLLTRFGVYSPSTHEEVVGFLEETIEKLDEEIAREQDSGGA